VAGMEKEILIETFSDAYIPEEFKELEGKSELRRGPRVRDLYYTKVGEKYLL